MKWVTLGEYIETFKEKCGNGNALVSGVDINKRFIPTKADLGTVDTSSYYNVPPHYFACNLMHIGRDKRIPIAYNDTNKILVVTKAYYVFKIKDIKKSEILNEYLYVFFNTKEKDRLAWFYTDSSIRGNLTETRFKEIKFPLPSLAKQKEIVDAWQGLKNLKEQNEKIADELFPLCQSYLQELKKEYTPVEIGEYVIRRDERNNDEKLINVKGLTVYKKFIDTKANMSNVSLKNYKIVYPGDIAYVSTTNRNGDRIACGLCQEKCIVSSIYDVLKINNLKILSEYLFLWFRRSEMDRYARFNSWGSAREVISYDD